MDRINKGTDWGGNGKNEKRPGSRRGGRSEDGKQRREIAARGHRMQRVKTAIPEHNK